MKNESVQKQKFSDEYRALQRKLFIRTAGMFLLAVLCVFLFYSYILHGNFANLTVRVLQIFTGDYDSALLCPAGIQKKVCLLLCLVGRRVCPAGIQKIILMFCIVWNAGKSVFRIQCGTDQFFREFRDMKNGAENFL